MWQHQDVMEALLRPCSTFMGEEYTTIFWFLTTFLHPNTQTHPLLEKKSYGEEPIFISWVSLFVNIYTMRDHLEFFYFLQSKMELKNKYL